MENDDRPDPIDKMAMGEASVYIEDFMIDATGFDVFLQTEKPEDLMPLIEEQLEKKWPSHEKQPAVNLAIALYGAESLIDLMKALAMVNLDGVIEEKVLRSLKKKAGTAQFEKENDDT